MGKKQKLQATLSSQQTRLKQNAKAKEAAQRIQKPGNAGSVKDRKSHLQVVNSATKNEKGTSDAKGKAKSALDRRRVTIPFQPTDTILLIGEGNFSFALALSSFSHPSTSSPSASTSTSTHPLAHLPSQNITATAYDSEEECYDKYPESREIIRQLRERSVELLFSVDATRLEKYKALKGRRWDRVVWNFPHAGKGIVDQDRNILANQTLLLGFLRSVPPFLKQGPTPVVHAKSRKRKRASDSDGEEDLQVADGRIDELDEDEGDVRLDVDAARTGNRGTVLITLRNVSPYTSWNLPSLAKHPPPPPTSSSQNPNPTYVQLRSFVFYRDMWPGYEHRMTKGERAHGTGTTGVGGEDRMWEFCVKD